MATAKLTAQGIKAASDRAKDAGADVWVSDDSSTRGEGRLQFRARPNGRHTFYWRYTAPNGATPRVTLGPYSPDEKAGFLTLKQARAAMAEKVTLYAKPETRDVRAHMERERQRIEAETLAAAEAKTAALTAAADAGKYTLAALFAAYIAHLRKQGKQSAYDAENLFDNHVTKAHPATAAMPANAVLAHDVVALLRPLTEAGKGRTAAKLRSYLRAAYALAARAALDSDAPAAFLPFKVAANPVQDTGALSKYSRALERALSAPELSAYWQALKDTPASVARDALLLLMQLGGQRPAQLMRATVADVDVHGKLLTLRDPKGKRAQPRVHALPLTDAALEVVNRCLERVKKQQEKRGDAKSTPHLFSTHGGAPMRPETLTGALNEIATALLTKPKAERVIVAPFQLRDLRRTCETRLAALGVSRDLRAQIQSHGLGGIQGRHYDKHDYATEKRAALEAWGAFLEAKPVANVQQLRGKARR